MTSYKVRIAIAIILLMDLAAPVQAATPKAGAKCTKALNHRLPNLA
jgi:hypothetical protein